jgi:hypothetical protein
MIQDVWSSCESYRWHVAMRICYSDIEEMTARCIRYGCESLQHHGYLRYILCSFGSSQRTSRTVRSGNTQMSQQSMNFIYFIYSVREPDTAHFEEKILTRAHASSIVGKYC